MVNRIVPALAAFDDVTIALNVTESSASVLRLTNWCVRTAVADSPSVMESVAASIVNECEVTVAWPGLTESIPKPNAAIAVIAIRLKNVVFDITFLSFVVDKTFLSAADRGFTSILWGNV